MINQIIHGDCFDVLKDIPDSSIDLILTDPPYGLKFMGKDWDHGVPGVQFWEQALRVAKPGAHLMVFGGTRTFHRLAVAIEDAGGEIRDTLMWVYGGGKPKSFTALKPAWEPIILARKPLVGTIAENVLKYGTGAINVDECRVGINQKDNIFQKNPHTQNKGKDGNSWFSSGSDGASYSIPEGRWPANLIHDGSDEVVGLFPYQKSGAKKPHIIKRDKGVVDFNRGLTQNTGYFPSSEGSAARFFYCAKASRKERGDGNTHPTVKPLALMKYLITLGLPPGGVVLDPFCGSGTTALACKELGRNYICIEKELEYYRIACNRLNQPIEDILDELIEEPEKPVDNSPLQLALF